jgi:tetratricopeptide (TPR) repeat protein
MQSAFRLWDQWANDLRLEWYFRHAELLVREGNPKAEQAVLEACQLATVLGEDRFDSRKTACYVLAADYYRTARQFQQTEYFCFRALHTAARHTPTVDHARTLVFTGECYRDFERYTLAEHRYDESGPIFRVIHGRREDRLAATLTMLGRHYKDIARFAKAEECMGEALDIYRGHSDSAGELIKCLLDLGLLALRGKRLEQAATFLEEAEYRAERLKKTVLPEIRLALAELHMEQQQFQRAELCLRSALEQALASDGRMNHLLGEVTVKLGRLYIETGRYDQAESLLGRGLDLLRHRLPVNDPQLQEIREFVHDLLICGEKTVFRRERTLIQPPRFGR